MHVCRWSCWRHQVPCVAATVIHIAAATVARTISSCADVLHLQAYLTGELAATKKLTPGVMATIKALALVERANDVMRQKRPVALPPEAFYNELIRLAESAPSLPPCCRCGGRSADNVDQRSCCWQAAGICPGAVELRFPASGNGSTNMLG